MDQIKLGVLPIMSHSWHKHSDSFLVVRAIKTLVNGIKALFGGYSVSLLDNITPKLVNKHPNAWFSKALHKPLSAYNISIPLACKESTSKEGTTNYIFNKVDRRNSRGDNLQVKLAFKQDGSVAPIPMYFSDNSSFPINLNGKARKPDNSAEGAGEKIFCRHFSWAYAKKVFGRGKSSFEKINSPEKIQSTLANTPNTPANHISKNGPLYFADGYYFTPDKFSEAFTKLVKKYWDIIPVGSEKNFLFNTSTFSLGHSMAIRLKKKAECLKVIFYDPNETLRHKTFLLSDPSLAAHITIEDLCPDSSQQDGQFINVDDTQQSIDLCDIQCFGGKNPVTCKRAFSHGHENHRIFK